MLKVKLLRGSALNHTAVLKSMGAIMVSIKKNKKGRPKAKWKSKANAERIFELMRTGKSLREICFEQKLPLSKVYEWLNGEYRDNYTLAQEARADKMFDDLLDIADDCSEDKDAVAKARLMIDTRKWVIGRMCPKKYGEKLGVDVSGNIEETHNGEVNITPSDTAIRGINAIIGAIIRTGKADSVEDTGKK